MLHLFNSCFAKALGAVTLTHLACANSFTENIHELWPIVFPQDAKMSCQSISKRTQFYSIDTIKMHSLKHILFHLITKGNLQNQSTAPHEHYNVIVKERYKHGSQRHYNSTKTAEQILARCSAERTIRCQLLVRTVHNCVGSLTYENHCNLLVANVRSKCSATRQN